MITYETDYTPHYYIVNNTAGNIADISSKINATEFLTCQIVGVVASANIVTITDVPQNPVIFMTQQATSKLCLITNVPDEDFELISVAFGELSTFPTLDWTIIQPIYL